jgi:hypothetical protein
MPTDALVAPLAPPADVTPEKDPAERAAKSAAAFEAASAETAERAAKSAAALEAESAETGERAAKSAAAFEEAALAAAAAARSPS